MLIAGMITVGSYFLIIELINKTPIPIILFMSGCLSYCVGLLIKGNYKWKKEGKNEKTN